MCAFLCCKNNQNLALYIEVKWAYTLLGGKVKKIVIENKIQ